MERAVGYKENRNRNDAACGDAPHEIKRLRAMADFRKNVKLGEYIDCDLYGRGDERVFSAIVSTGEENSKTQKEDITATRAGDGPMGRFASARFIGKKIRGFLGNLIRKIDCFGRRSSRLSIAAEDNDSEGTSHVTRNSSPVPVGGQGEHFDDRDSANVDALAALAPDERVETKAENSFVEIESMKEVKEDESPSNMVGGTPRRVRSKVDSGDGLKVVEKGMVVLTLKKLQSTGSFMFKQPSSFASQHPTPTEEELQANQSSLLDSNNPTAAMTGRHSSPSRDHRDSKDGSSSPSNASHPRSTDSAEAQAEIDDVERNNAGDADAQSETANHVIDGDVKRRRSLLEDDTTIVVNAVVENELQTNEEKEPTEESPQRDTASTQSPMNSEELQAAVVEVKSESFAEGTDTPHAAATNTASGSVKELGTSVEKYSFDVPDKIVPGRLSSVLNVTTLTAEPESSNKDVQGAWELVKSEAASGVEGCEQAPPMSVQELSQHLSGRVDKIKALFDSRSGDTAMRDENVEFPKTATFIHAGLSRDSAVFNVEGEQEDVGIINVEVESEMNDTKMDENRVGEGALRQEVDECLDSRGDARQRDVDGARKIPELVADVDEVIREAARGSERSSSSRASSQVDGSDESPSASTASSEDLSHPVSHLVGSCVDM